MQERAGTATVAAAKRWLDAQSGAPTFCWIHLYEPHFPYRPPEPYKGKGVKYANEYIFRKEGKKK
jgi:hypothetical protein